MRIALLTLISASLLFAQAPATADKNMTAVVTFVAPAYPRAARDQRKMGKILTCITVNRDGASLLIGR